MHACSKKTLQIWELLPNEEAAHLGPFFDSFLISLFPFRNSDACMFCKVTIVMGIEMEYMQTQS